MRMQVWVSFFFLGGGEGLQWDVGWLDKLGGEGQIGRRGVVGFDGWAGQGMDGWKDWSSLGGFVRWTVFFSRRRSAEKKLTKVDKKLTKS